MLSSIAFPFQFCIFHFRFVFVSQDYAFGCVFKNMTQSAASQPITCLRREERSWSKKKLKVAMHIEPQHLTANVTAPNIRKVARKINATTQMETLFPTI
jgi:hypothetical protein